MKLHTVGIALLLAASPWAAQAAKLPDLSHVIDPGEWAYTVEANIQIGKTKIPPRTRSNKRCITQKELDRNKNWFADTHKQCTTQSVNYSGHVLTFTLQCKTEGRNMTVKGRMNIESRTAYHVVVDATGNVGGQEAKIHNTIKGHRTGACTAEKSSQ